MIRQCFAWADRLDRNTALTPYGVFALRIVLTAIWAAHFWFKVGYRGMPATDAFFQSLGYPWWFAWLDIAAEAVAMVMMAAGVYVRAVSIVMLVVLIPATAVWIPKGFYFVNAGYEFMLTWCILQVVQALLGPGALTLDFHPFARRTAARA
jgi:putative oxidoreductase